MVPSVVKSRPAGRSRQVQVRVDGILSIIKNEGIGGVYKGVRKQTPSERPYGRHILFVGQKKNTR